jgi:NAD(P)-dependent dehydrogenase (short-subunit alcohol dehydrogenase family)
LRYFVTGATGFIGRHLVELLLARGGTVHALVRESSLDQLLALCERWGVGPERVIPVVGNLETPLLGVDPTTLAELRGRVDHLFHVAALYDMAASERSLEAANVLGTWHAVQLANAAEVGRFHHVSSIAAAGRYRGVFREDMFEEATGLDDPYFRTKHASERVVRSECRVPWRIYRPGIVVGHSETGEMDKVDGPYYFFRLLRQLGAALPSWLPLVGIEGGPINIVPVDFVARAMDHIAHSEGLDRRCFHLVDPKPASTSETLNVFAEVARAPQLAFSLDVGPAERIPEPMSRALTALPTRALAWVLRSEFGIPPRLVRAGAMPTRFDCRETLEALEGTGIEVPPLESYAERIWNYWEANLDCDLRHSPALARVVAGKRVLVTGASAGIGRAAALKLGAAGARVLLVARSAERLESARTAIAKAGGVAFAYPADLSSAASCDLLAKRVLDEHGGVDVLVNNAGRSIRRSLELEYERFHDFERTMELNYFGALKLILAFLPGMRERGRGHIVNVSTMGVQTSGPQFAAYLASKSALDAFSRSAASEILSDGVAITTVYMPLVKTEMSAPTAVWDSFFALTPAQAADMVCYAIRWRPKRVGNPIGLLTELAYLAAPRALDLYMSLVYRLSPDSPAARGEQPNEPEAIPGLSAALRRLGSSVRVRRSRGPSR